MALLGVLLAFCAAEVGAQRTELTKAMVEQTQVSAESQADQMKYRLVMLELEKVRAAMPAAGEAKAAEPVKAEGGADAPKAEGMSAADATRAKTLDRLLQLVSQYIDWKETAKAWVKTYDPVIEAHAEAAEGFERAQLSAEVGIVLASIALLLANKKVWFVSIAIAILTIVLLGKTHLHSHHALSDGEHAVEASREKYEHLRKVQDPNADDARTLEALDPGGKRRKAYAVEHAGSEAPAGEKKHGEH